MTESIDKDIKTFIINMLRKKEKTISRSKGRY